MAKENSYPMLPMCEMCVHKCKKRTSKEMIESFRNGNSQLYCKNFQKISKGDKK